MAKPRKRRKTIVDPVRPGWIIERASKDKVRRVGEIVDLSESAFIDEMVAHLELDARGVPVWWPYPVAIDDGELPIGDA